MVQQVGVGRRAQGLQPLAQALSAAPARREVAEAVRLLVTTGRTLALVAVGSLSAAPDARDPLLQQGEFFLEFGDPLPMALDPF